jgi:hypothetical protein
MDTCYFNQNGSQTHKEFIWTGFKSPELNVIKDNGLVDEIKRKNPDYNEVDLRKNDYKLYYKNYPYWRTSCLEEYSTEDVSNAGRQLELVADQLKLVFYLGLTFFLVDLLFLIIRGCCF